MITVHNLPSGKTLAVNGVPQSSWPPQKGTYWEMMIPDKRPETVLMLGVGAGTLARMLLEKWSDIQITGIEISEEVINAAHKHMGLKEIKMRLITADAFDYVFEDKNTYDLILIDIFDGYNFPLKFLMPKFVKRCQELLNKGGELYINTPNLAHGISLLLPTRTAQENTGNVVYKYESSS